MYSVESYFLQKKRIGKEKRINHTVSTDRNISTVSKKQWNVTWEYSIKILTWLQEADNDSCGWCVTKKKKKLSFSYPVVLQVVCFLRSSRTCSQKQCVYLPTWGHNVWIFCYREKKAGDKRCQIGRKVNAESMEKKQQTWIKKQLQILSLFASKCNMWCVSLKTYLSTSDWSWCGRPPLKPSPPPIWYHKLRIICNYLTQVCRKSDYKPLAVATSHVGRTDIDHTHTHIKPKLSTTMNSFARF